MRIRQLWLFLPIFVALFMQGSPVALAQTAPVPEPEKTVQPAPGETETIATAPVTIDGRELFSMRGIKAFPAGERARTIAARIRNLARDPSVSTELAHAVRV